MVASWSKGGWYESRGIMLKVSVLDKSTIIKCGLGHQSINADYYLENDFACWLLNDSKGVWCLNSG